MKISHTPKRVITAALLSGGVAVAGLGLAAATAQAQPDVAPQVHIPYATDNFSEPHQWTELLPRRMARRPATAPRSACPGYNEGKQPCTELRNGAVFPAHAEIICGARNGQTDYFASSWRVRSSRIGTPLRPVRSWAYRPVAYATPPPLMPSSVRSM